MTFLLQHHPAIVSTSLDVVWMVPYGTGNRDGTAWGSWLSLGGQIDLLAATSSGNSVYVFGRGSDESLWFRNSDGTTWGSWLSQGGQIDLLAATSTGGNTVASAYDLAALNAVFAKTAGKSGVFEAPRTRSSCRRPLITQPTARISQ